MLITYIHMPEIITRQLGLKNEAGIGLCTHG